jgi:precorrin-6Y C5,15-methyltransferase (decarboxylating)
MGKRWWRRFKTMLYIIGIGLKGRESLSQDSLKLIDRAGLLVGGARHLDEFPEFKGKKVLIRSDLARVAGAIDAYTNKGGKSRKGRKLSTVVVLATGDPNLFGIADFLVNRFGKKRVRIVPNVSPVQEAFARIKENLNNVKVLSVHGRGEGLEGVVSEIISFGKSAVFTDRVNTPQKIARALVKRGINGFSTYVCEALGTKEERITKGSLKTIAQGSYHPLNVMILIRDRKSPPALGAVALKPMASKSLFGIPDKEFKSSGGMITKQEIRVIALSKLLLEPESVVWDIGSGSGSVAVEAARIASSGTVYAVEKEKNRVKVIEENRQRFAIKNLKIICGTAPGCLRDGSFPRPDRVFIGGGGGRGGRGGRGGNGLSGILSYVSRRIKKGGTIVINAVTIDTLSAAAGFFKRRGWGWDVVSVNIAKTKSVEGLDILSANNPVFIISARKP